MSILKNIFSNKYSQPEQNSPVQEYKEDVKGNTAERFFKVYLDDKYSQDNCAGIFLSALAREIEIVQAVLLKVKKEKSQQYLAYAAGYACQKKDPEEYKFEIGEGLPGQVLKDKKKMYLEKIPEDYLSIKTGLGEAIPHNLAILPVLKGKNVIAVLELATFCPFTDHQKSFLEEVLMKFSEKCPKFSNAEIA